jgi:hypothetical protein
MGPKVGEIWFAQGLMPHEAVQRVRIYEVLESGNV